MNYVKGYWVCPVCPCRSKEALKLALHQYRIIISPNINNRAFREFVGIDNKGIASKVLVRSGMQQIGKKRGAYFVIPEDIFEKRKR